MSSKSDCLPHVHSQGNRSRRRGACARLCNAQRRMHVIPRWRASTHITGGGARCQLAMLLCRFCGNPPCLDAHRCCLSQAVWGFGVPAVHGRCAGFRLVGLRGPLATAVLFVIPAR